MRLLPVHAQRTTVHQHDDERLARRSHSLHQVFRWLGQIQSGAVSTGEARLIHRHLLAFKTARDADYGDNHVRILSCGYSSGIGRIVYRGPDQLRLTFAFSKPAVTYIEFD